MPGMGPPPKAPGTRARQNRTLPMTTLPAAGRKGAAPEWPLPDDIAKQVMAQRTVEKVDNLQDLLREDVPARTRAKLERELDQALTMASVLAAEIAAQHTLESALWAELWSTPQAAQWEALGWHRDVAQYVRHKVRGELGSLDDAKEARQWSDRLGLNPLAMLRLRWETERAEEAEERGRRRRAVPQPTPAKKPAKGHKAVDPRRVLAAVPDSA